jgi:hypothetical protein
MDIRENFYSKLQQVREDYDPNDAKMARNAKKVADGIISRLGQKKWNKKAKRLQNKAVTGMEEPSKKTKK